MWLRLEEEYNRGRSCPHESAAPISPSPASPKVGAVIRAMNCDIRWATVDFHARRLLMSRDGAIIFADLIGKLDALYKSGHQRRG
jgi:hypothetical protein